MFESLSDKLQRVFKTLRGEGRLTEANIAEPLEEIRLALLEADVNQQVADDLVASIRTRALGQDVMDALAPGEQVVKILRDELLQVLGGESRLNLKTSQPPATILMAGLQGSGKTTSSGKLARWLRQQGHRPLLVSVDIYRPAARQQLALLAQQLPNPIFSGDSVMAELAATPSPSQATRAVLDLARGARREAVRTGCDVLIVDTAGRLHVDDTLMEEMRQLKALLSPQEILFVADAMTGQDAVRSAAAFHQQLALTGVVLTKMDGDSRGGAALSIRRVTSQPIKFMGTSERMDGFEVFHPDRIAGRILGMGDILSLIERAEQTVDRKQALDLEKRLRTDSFTLGDFRDQLRQVRKLGPLENLVKMLPRVGPFQDLHRASNQVDEGQIAKVEAIINSMTAEERAHHQLINGSRRKRIARGSGVSVQDVNQVLKQYVQMRKMFKSVAGSSFLTKKLMGRG
ncbi:MAG TPA: signal recognition particle protein [Terriglobales bacterium]|nr:signal recognition particle protein [Terriglobales bacterium]